MADQTGMTAKEAALAEHPVVRAILSVIVPSQDPRGILAAISVLQVEARAETQAIRDAAEAVIREWDALGPTGTQDTLTAHAALRAALRAARRDDYDDYDTNGIGELSGPDILLERARQELNRGQTTEGSR